MNWGYEKVMTLLVEFTGIGVVVSIPIGRE